MISSLFMDPADLSMSIINGLLDMPELGLYPGGLALLRPGHKPRRFCRAQAPVAAFSCPEGGAWRHVFFSLILCDGSPFPANLLFACLDRIPNLRGACSHAPRSRKAFEWDSTRFAKAGSFAGSGIPATLHWGLRSNSKEELAAELRAGLVALTTEGSLALGLGAFILPSGSDPSEALACAVERADIREGSRL